MLFGHGPLTLTQVLYMCHYTDLANQNTARLLKVHPVKQSIIQFTATKAVDENVTACLDLVLQNHQTIDCNHDQLLAHIY